MQAIILAAGRGERMGALTDNTPKALLEVAGKTFLEHKFDALPYDVDEIILIVGYMGSKILDRFNGRYKDKHILYVEQENPKGGTAEALWNAKSVLHDSFLVMNSDGIYALEDMAKCAAYEWAILVQEMESVRTGRVILDKKGNVERILESGSHAGEKGYANTGLYKLDMRIFDYPPGSKANGSPERGLPQTIAQAAHDIEIKAVPASLWCEVKTPEDLQKSEEMLGNRAL